MNPVTKKLLTYTYVDNSNVFIEGQRVSAVQQGMAKDIFDATARNISDHGWNLDYGKLHTLICGDKSEVGAANLWGSPPPGDSFWKKVEKHGFTVEKFDRSKYTGTEKKVDVAIAHRMTKDAYTKIDKASSEITLVAGDSDFVPVVKDLVGEGFKVYVAFWDHASRELRETATGFFSLNTWVDHLRF